MNRRLKYWNPVSDKRFHLTIEEEAEIAIIDAEVSKNWKENARRAIDKSYLKRHERNKFAMARGLVKIRN